MHRMEIILLNKQNLDGEESKKALFVDSVSSWLMRVYSFLLVFYIK